MKMKPLDHELMEEIRERALRTRELSDSVGTKREIVQDKISDDLKYIKTVCKEEEWTPEFYVKYYYKMFWEEG